MKKLISMMMLLCAVISFSACSSDDDGDAKNPVSNIVVPSTAAIGSEQTIQGSGFAQGMTIQFVQGDNSYDVATKVSANGATFTVPYTLTEGAASIVLKHGSNQWTIGQTTLTAAANPIISPSVAENLAIGKAATIGGSGFAEGDVVYLESAADASVNAEAQGTVASDGLQFTVPADLAEGDYNVYVKRGNSKWNLQTSNVYKARRIKTVTYDNMMVQMLGVKSLELNFEYDEEGKLSAINTNGGFGWKFSYNPTGAGKYEVTTQSPINDAVMTFTMENGKVLTSTPTQPNDATEKLNTWTYSGNHLSTVLNSGIDYRGCQLKTNTYNAAGDLETIDCGGEMGFTFGTVNAMPYNIDPCYFVNLMTYMLSGEDIIVGMLLNQTVLGSKHFPTVAKAYSVDQNGADVWTDVNMNTTFANNVLTIDMTQTVADAGMYPTKITVTYEDK